MNVAVTFGEFTASIVDGQLIVNGVKHESLEEYLEWGEMVYCGSIEPSIVRIMEAMAQDGGEYMEGKLAAIAEIAQNRFYAAEEEVLKLQKAVHLLDQRQEEFWEEDEEEEVVPKWEDPVEEEMSDVEVEIELFELENIMDERDIKALGWPTKATPIWQ